MMARKFDRILDDCLSRMDRGESLMDILAHYPSQADNLKPLMLAAMLSRAIPQPVPGYTALRMGKNQLLAEMASMQSEDSFIKPKAEKVARESLVDRLAIFLKQLQPAYRFAMVSMVVILTGGFFTLSASASGLADNIMHTLFYSFEQVGDLLLVKPALPKSWGENPLFTSDSGLPDSPPDYSGDYKGLMVDEDKNRNKEDIFSDELMVRIETREYSLVDNYDEETAPTEEDLIDIVLNEIDMDDIDEKDLEKEVKEEEKDLEKEEKEEEKDLEKEEKDEEKEDDKAEKEAEKDEKEAEKDADKEAKEDEKDKDK